MAKINVIDFNKAKQRKASKVTQVQYSSADPIADMLDNDICNLAEATGVTKEEAIKVASDFYRRYPMLIEHVRSPEFMLRGK